MTTVAEEKNVASAVTRARENPPSRKSAEHYWGQALQEDEFVISADEKTSIQARARIHPTQAPQPDQPMKVEHEYERRGALAYLAALDVHQAKLFGHCQPQSGIIAFDRLVDR